MKKWILAIVALACAFAISSCCDQGYCPKNNRCSSQAIKSPSSPDETPCRWDQKNQPPACQERQHRRW